LDCPFLIKGNNTDPHVLNNILKELCNVIEFIGASCCAGFSTGFVMVSLEGFPPCATTECLESNSNQKYQGKGEAEFIAHRIAEYENGGR